MAMRSKRNELTGALYEDVGDGLVRVSHDGQTGIFRYTGEWVEGGITVADPHMLLWVGGRDLPGAADFISVRARALLKVMRPIKRNSGSDQNAQG